jgi:hypothetical protein
MRSCADTPAPYLTECRRSGLGARRQEARRADLAVGPFWKDSVNFLAGAYGTSFLRRTRSVLAPNGRSSNAPATQVAGSGTITNWS